MGPHHDAWWAVVIERTSSPSPLCIIPPAYQHTTQTRCSSPAILPQIRMLYRVCYRSSRFDTVNRIQTSPLSYAQRVKRVPERVSQPPVKEKTKEEVVADEPYGKCHVLCPDRLLSNGS